MGQAADKRIAQLLGLERESMPHHNTYRRVLADAIDEYDFEHLVWQCHRYRGQTGYQMVAALDGKVVRGTIDGEQENGLYLLAVLLPGEGVMWAQVAIPSHQNEISTAPTLLSHVDLRNKVVIGDACIPKGRFHSRLDRQAVTTYRQSKPTNPNCCKNFMIGSI